MESLLAIPPQLELTWSERIAYIAWKMKQDGGHTAEDFPVTQWIDNGRYIREFRLPADLLFIGRIHKVGHIVLLCEGSATLLTPKGSLVHHAPDAMNTPAGFQTVARTSSSVLVRTIHPLPLAESYSFEELEEYFFEPPDRVLALGKQIQKRVQEQLEFSP